MAYNRLILAYCYQCSHKQPPSLLLKLNQILNSFTPGGSFMFKWPEKKNTITDKLLLDFRIIKTMLHVLGDFSKKGQIWNGFDDSEARLSHQKNILTISGHYDVDQSTPVMKGCKTNKLGPKHQGNWKKLKMALWNTWFDIFTLKNPAFFPISQPCVSQFSKTR